MSFRLLALPIVLFCCLQNMPAQDIELRARCTQLEPSQPVRIHWRWGGEGLGGSVISGELTEFLPDPTGRKNQVAPKDRIIVSGKTFNHEYLFPETWSRWHPVSSFKSKGKQKFITFTLQGKQSGKSITKAELEFEFRHHGKLLKRISISGPDGPTFGVVLPLQHIDSDGKPKDGFVTGLGSLKDYAQGKVRALSEQPWAKLPAPKLYSIITDCTGYKPGSGYACRTSDKETMLAEFEVLRLLGFNGTRSLPDFVLKEIEKGEGIGPQFSKSRKTHTMGYPIPMVKRSDGKAPRRSPGDGCPNHPANRAVIQERVAEAVSQLVKEAKGLPVEEIWALTVDEIGSVFDGAPEGKAHMGACEFCQEDFRNFVKKDGRTLEEFGAPDWSHIRPTYGYWSKSYWAHKEKLENDVADAKKLMNSAINRSFDLDKPEGEEPDSILQELEELAPKPKRQQPTNESKALILAEKRLKDFIWNGKPNRASKADPKHHLSESGWKLLHYYSRKYNAETSARMFTQLKDALDTVNEEKEGTLPPIYSYALRGNTFLMGGHSLGFFDFYKHADNDFVYETSNRDPRVWQWDSYLCDVGRSLSRFRGKQFAVYVKPHRGAPVQRALTAVARGARMIYWYAYGPEWKKGDSFGGKLETLEKIGWVNRLISQAEDVIYDSEWAVPAQVAIVRPRTAEFLSGPASWENGKWVHTALMHAQIPVDALDEDLLMELDLQQYKSIFVCGDHIRREVAEKLKQWVKDGGHLVTYCNGMSRDEANQPLKTLWPMFGVEKREDPEIWGKVSKYGATRLKAVEQIGKPPEGAGLRTVPNPGMQLGDLSVGRELLYSAKNQPLRSNHNLLYQDGNAANVINGFGKGITELVGTYSGLEYATNVMNGQSFDFQKLMLIAPSVIPQQILSPIIVGEPLVEGLLLKNKGSGKHALILINWKFDSPDGVTVLLNYKQPFNSATSLALGESFTIKEVSIHLPSLKEGDILLLD